MTIALSRLFRRLFLTQLHAAFDAGALQFFASLESLRDRSAFLQHLAPARRAEWVVYAKPPFAGPQQVLDYVGRYTHRVAISNNRLLDMDDGHVRFRYKDYRADRAETQKMMTLPATEFIRRVLLHVLPLGFHRLRYYGLLGNRHRQEKLARCRQLLGTVAPETPASTVPADLAHCRGDELRAPLRSFSPPRRRTKKALPYRAHAPEASTETAPLREAPQTQERRFSDVRRDLWKTQNVSLPATG